MHSASLFSVRASALVRCSIALVLTCVLADAARADIPPPEEVNLDYKDGLQLKATFYPGTKGKDSVPVILLHGWKGSRADMEDLALYLQAQEGCAVFVPDLRGHGKSTKIKRPELKDEEVSAAKFRPADFAALVDDMEKMKTFLLEKHNAQLLNIDKLTVVGAELGATIAVKWAKSDWSWPDLAGGKQGRDVKALVLISPETNYKGLNLISDLDDPDIRSKLSFLIMAGKNGPPAGAQAADRIIAKLKPYHLDPPKEEAAEKTDLFLWIFDTAMQGTKIFGVKPLKKNDADKKEQGVDYRALVAGFIELRLVKKDYPWVVRRAPGQ